MVMSQINMTCIRLLVFFLVLTTIHAQNVCTGNSTCVNIRNCPEILSILTDSRPLSAQMLQTVRNSLCGFESMDPKYCCNHPITTTTTTTTATVKPGIPDPPDVTNHPNLRLLDHQACGVVPQQRLIGDNKTDIFQYPWMALIGYNFDVNTGYTLRRCGTVISSRYVLTAASSARRYLKDGAIVRVGDYDISKERDCIKDNEGVEIVCAERYQDFGIDNIHLHPEYNGTRRSLSPWRNDIALIRLNGTVDFRPRNVKPICLPFGTAATLSRKKAIVTGGYTITHNRVQQMKLPLITNEHCNELVKVKDHRRQIWYTQLCTSGDRYQICWTKSGDPLQAAGIYNGKSVRIIQHGVLNFGICSGTAGVYTRVSYYMDWILDTMTD